MRDNPIKGKLADGGTAFGTMVFEFISPGLAQVLANAGADFVFYDMEHSGFTMEDMKQQFAYCRGLGLVPLVRPPGKAYQFTARLLDLGAMGVLYQMVESAEEAAELLNNVCNENGTDTSEPDDGSGISLFGSNRNHSNSRSIQIK